MASDENESEISIIILFYEISENMPDAIGIKNKTFIYD